MPDDYKAAFDKAMKASVEYYWDIAPKDDEESLQFMIDKGNRFVEPSDEFKAQMKDAMKPVYDWMDKNWESSPAIREFFDSKR